MRSFKPTIPALVLGLGLGLAAMGQTHAQILQGYFRNFELDKRIPPRIKTSDNNHHLKGRFLRQAIDTTGLGDQDLFDITYMLYRDFNLKTGVEWNGECPQADKVAGKTDKANEWKNASPAKATTLETFLGHSISHYPCYDWQFDSNHVVLNVYPKSQPVTSTPFNGYTGFGTLRGLLDNEELFGFKQWNISTHPEGKSEGLPHRAAWVYDSRLFTLPSGTIREALSGVLAEYTSLAGWRLERRESNRAALIFQVDAKLAPPPRTSEKPLGDFVPPLIPE